MKKQTKLDEYLSAFVATLNASAKRKLFVLLGEKVIRVKREPAKTRRERREASH